MFLRVNVIIFIIFDACISFRIKYELNFIEIYMDLHTTIWIWETFFTFLICSYHFSEKIVHQI